MRRVDTDARHHNSPIHGISDKLKRPIFYYQTSNNHTFLCVKEVALILVCLGGKMLEIYVDTLLCDHICFCFFYFWKVVPDLFTFLTIVDISLLTKTSKHSISCHATSYSCYQEKCT